MNTSPPLIAVIINFKAMAIRRRALSFITRLQKIADQHENVEIVLTDNVEETPDDIRKLKRKGVKYICCCGGDGTLRLIIQTVIEVYGKDEYPIVTSIGGGSMSMVAKALRLKKSPHKNLQRVIELSRCEYQPVSRTQVLKIKYDQQTKYGFLFSLGVVVDYLKYYEKSNKGWLVAIKLILACILGTIIPRFRIHHYMKAKVTHDGQEFEKDTFAGILVSNVKKLVLTFRPLSGFLHPNQFLLGIFALNAWEIISRLPKYMWGYAIKKHHKQGKMFNGNAARVEIETNEDFTIDGDVIERKEGEKKHTRTFVITPGPSIPMLNLDLFGHNI